MFQPPGGLGRYGEERNFATKSFWVPPGQVWAGFFRGKSFEEVSPMISRERVAAILYSDNALSDDPLPDLSGIEILMAQAGLAMEKVPLERQLMHLRKSIPYQLE